MRISDWSSDVCSSDLGGDDVGVAGRGAEDVGAADRLFHRHDLISFHRRLQRADRIDLGDEHARAAVAQARGRALADVAEARDARDQIGRATSELQSLMRISYAVFCLKKKKQYKDNIAEHPTF